MDEQPIDLTALDPTRDPDWRERVAHDIAKRAMEARRARRDVYADVLGWWRPALLAAGLVGVVAATALSVWTPVPVVAVRRSRPPATDLMGVPDHIKALLASSESPSLVQLAEAFSTLDREPDHGR